MTQKHTFAEAFLLMWYGCNCGHAERIWNSRDGITPFSMRCPSCGESTLQHIRFDLDEYAPSHQLRSRQRYWRDGTVKDARDVVAARIEHFAAIGRPIDAETIESMVASAAERRYPFEPGWPIIDTHP